MSPVGGTWDGVKAQPVGAQRSPKEAASEARPPPTCPLPVSTSAKSGHTIETGPRGTAAGITVGEGKGLLSTLSVTPPPPPRWGEVALCLWAQQPGHGSNSLGRSPEGRSTRGWGQPRRSCLSLRLVWRPRGRAGAGAKTPYLSPEWCKKRIRKAGGISFKRLKCCSVTRRFCQACGRHSRSQSGTGRGCPGPAPAGTPRDSRPPQGGSTLAPGSATWAAPKASLRAQVRSRVCATGTRGGAAAKEQRRSPRQLLHPQSSLLPAWAPRAPHEQMRAGALRGASAFWASAPHPGPLEGSGSRVPAGRSAPAGSLPKGLRLLGSPSPTV